MFWTISFRMHEVTIVYRYGETEQVEIQTEDSIAELGAVGQRIRLGNDIFVFEELRELAYLLALQCLEEEEQEWPRVNTFYLGTTKPQNATIHYAHKPMVYVASGRVDDKELLEQIKNDFVAENATRCLIKHGERK